MTKVLPIGCLLLFGTVLFGDEVTKRTAVTLNEPVIVAGVPVVTLEPGNYVLRLLNHDHNRNIVQIFNDRENKLFTTVLAIPNYGLVAKDKTVFRFYETPAGNPIALRAWFAEGDNWGQEFVYPKGLAPRIARESAETVLETPAETVAELETAPVTEVTKEGEEQPLEEAYLPPEPAPATVAEAAPAAPAFEPEPVLEELPKTATSFYTIGLIGILGLAAGIGLRYSGLHRS